jgi:hypothetical protein
VDSTARKRRIRSAHPSPAMIVACLALAVALSGVGYAAVKLPRGSVGTAQLKANAVKSPKVAPNTLVGADINEAKLGMVPSAANADQLDSLDSTAFARTTSEAWRMVGAPGQPAFTDNCGSVLWANWAEGGTSFNEVGFYKDSVGIVHLKGLAAHACNDGNGAGTTIFTLPVGYRPLETELQVTLSNNTVNRINVNANGTVVPELAVGNNASIQWISLDGISFRAEN